MARQRKRRRATPGRSLRRWFRRQGLFSRGLLLGAVVFSALIAVLMLPLDDKKPPERHAALPSGARVGDSPPAAPRPRAAAKPAPKARREVPAPEPPRSRAAPSLPPGERPAVPRVAIVIDDLGQRLSDLEQLAALDVPLTIAVIPGLPATAATVREASRLGIEMILHQPMEPREEGGKNPGNGVLLTAMSGEEVQARLRESLAAVPGAVGVNNHMGSRFTEEDAGLAPLMAELRARGLFWLDSRTTAATRGAEVAHGAGVPAIERDVFLDAEVSAGFIRNQLRRLVETARARGAAVGIGHPHPETIAVLRELRGELLDSGVTLAPLSALVPGTTSGTALAAAHKGENIKADHAPVAVGR